MWTKLSINWMQWTNTANKSFRLSSTFSTLLILDWNLINFINAGLVSPHTLGIDIDSEGLGVRNIPGDAQSLSGLLRPGTHRKNMTESSVEDLLVEYVLRHRVKSNTALVSGYQRHTSEYCVVRKELIKFSANLPRDRDCLAFMMG